MKLVEPLTVVGPYLTTLARASSNCANRAVLACWLPMVKLTNSWVVATIGVESFVPPSSTRVRLRLRPVCARPSSVTVPVAEELEFPAYPAKPEPKIASARALIQFTPFAWANMSP